MQNMIITKQNNSSGILNTQYAKLAAVMGLIPTRLT